MNAIDLMNDTAFLMIIVRLAIKRTKHQQYCQNCPVWL